MTRVSRNGNACGEVIYIGPRKGSIFGAGALPGGDLPLVSSLAEEFRNPVVRFEKFGAV